MTRRPRPQNQQTRPLDGLRVLDLSRAVSGPLAGRILADLGADVVRAELPGTDGDGEKRSVVRMPYRFSDAASGPVRGVPEPGEHTEDVLRDWTGRADLPGRLPQAPSAARGAGAQSAVSPATTAMSHCRR